MSQAAFRQKWGAIRAGGKKSNLEEKNIYVEPGEVPRTQRQLSLYHYFLFIKDHLSKIGAKNIIELGCGRGTIGLYCQTYLGLEVTLMDTEENAIEIARQAFSTHRAAAHFLVGDALRTGLASASFDATVSIGLAEHLDNVEDLFAEQYRILRPGGIMISLNIPKKISVQYLNTAMRAVKKLVGLYEGSVTKDYYRNSYSARQYEQFAKNAGFQRTAVVPVCPFPFYVPISRPADRFVTSLRRGLLIVRALFMKYPYKTNALLAHSHFLVGYKPNHEK